MEFIERVLDERASDLTEALAAVGLSPVEARRFLDEATPELLQSYAWNATLEVPRAAVAPRADDVLSTIHGQVISDRAGLPEAKTWAALRTLVPAVLAASRDETGCEASSAVEGSEDVGSEGRTTTTLDVGFGLTVEGLTTRDERQGRPGVGHPVFGKLLSQE